MDNAATAIIARFAGLAAALDAAPGDLAAHDARYHPGGYKPGDKCALREGHAASGGGDVWHIGGEDDGEPGEGYGPGYHSTGHPRLPEAQCTAADPANCPYHRTGRFAGKHHHDYAVPVAPSELDAEITDLLAAHGVHHGAVAGAAEGDHRYALRIDGIPDKKSADLAATAIRGDFLNSAEEEVGSSNPVKKQKDGTWSIVFRADMAPVLLDHAPAPPAPATMGELAATLLSSLQASGAPVSGAHPEVFHGLPGLALPAGPAADPKAVLAAVQAALPPGVLLRPLNGPHGAPTALLLARTPDGTLHIRPQRSHAK